MDRRGFLKMFSAGAAGLALEQAIPFGRVWSFPSKIVIPTLSLGELESRYLAPAVATWAAQMGERFAIGDIVTMPAFADPDRYVVTAVHSESVYISTADRGKTAVVCGRAVNCLVPA